MIPKNKICTLIPFIPTFPPTPPVRQKTTEYIPTEGVQARWISKNSNTQEISLFTLNFIEGLGLR